MKESGWISGHVALTFEVVSQFQVCVFYFIPRGVTYAVAHWGLAFTIPQLMDIHLQFVTKITVK